MKTIKTEKTFDERKVSMKYNGKCIIVEIYDDKEKTEEAFLLHGKEIDMAAKFLKEVTKQIAQNKLEAESTRLYNKIKRSK